MVFTDRVVLSISAGKGGNGVIAWRREKYIPKGGPCGGNGGHGGNVYIIADVQQNSLEAYRDLHQLKAQNGQPGGSNDRSGRNGEDLFVKVPCGTLVKDAITGQILCDLTQDKEQWLACEGGKGGKGNTHFKSSTHRAPYVCTKGEVGAERQLEFELKLIADVGLVGFPNAGKSTLLSRLASVDVKIASYPFTTLTPNLGYMRGAYGADGEAEQRVWIADIPGIIEGAHQNRGLGLEFLRHIERTRILLFVIDVSGDEERDPLKDFSVLREELQAYRPDLLRKPFLVALNKVDTEYAQEYCERFRDYYPYGPETLVEISALSGQGLENLALDLKRKLNR